MKTKLTYTLLAVMAYLMLLSSCQKHGESAETQEPAQTVTVRFNTFLKEGDNVRPIELGSNTRDATTAGTLANGFNLYGHSHTLPFATYADNKYNEIFRNVIVRADGTYDVPKFWLDKSTYYSFQAYAGTEANGNNFPPTDITFDNGVAPYVNSKNLGGLSSSPDILTASTFDIRIGDEIPTVNLYFEHRMARVIFKTRRMNAGGPTLYNVVLKANITNVYTGCKIKWAMERNPTINNFESTTGHTLSTSQTISSSEMGAVFANDIIIAPQTLPDNWLTVDLSYTLDPNNSTSKTISTKIPAITLISGQQVEIVIGHIVETDQLVVNSVSLTDWVTEELSVPEYK